MELMQKDRDTSNLRGIAGSHQGKSAKNAEDVSVTADADTQEERLWESAIANSLDVIRDLADKALAERRAGRTKKITL